ncbi:MAG TPA: SDR family oxidoreductase [Longimicrobiales bacterium]
MPRPIAEQVVVITGASSGIGLAAARAAAHRGARVVLAARNARDLEDAAASIRQGGGEALAVPTDVADFAQVGALARRAVDAYGRIDTWVNGAAVSLYGEFEDLAVDEVRRVMDVNFMGQVHGAKAALPHLEESGGALVCIGSVLSDRGVPLQTAYCASKHAIKGWLDGLRVELRRRRSPVRVTLVKPSSINTPLFDKARTHLGVQPRPLPPVYSVELAAEAVLHAAVSNERDLIVGGAGAALSLAERVSPKLVDLYARFLAFAGQRTARPKPADAPNNLFEPVSYDGGERGGSAEVGRSAYQPIAEHGTAAALVASALCGLGAWGIRRADPSATAPAALLGAGALLLAGKALLSAAYEG